MCGNWRGEVYLYSIKKNSFTLYKAYERNNVLYIYRDFFIDIKISFFRADCKPRICPQGRSGMIFRQIINYA